MMIRRRVPRFRSFLLCLLSAGALLAPSAAARAGPRGIPFRPGDRLSTAIRPAGDADDFVFDGLAGGTIRLYVRPAKGSPLLPSLEVRDPECAALDLSGLLAERKGRVKVSALPLPVTGRYLVRVGSANGETGGYELRSKGKPPRAVKRKDVLLAAGATLDLPFAGDDGATARASIRAGGGADFEILSVLAPDGSEVPGAAAAFRARGTSRMATIRLDSGFGDYRIRVGAAPADAVLRATVKVRFPAPPSRRTAISPEEPRVTGVEPAVALALEPVTVVGENFAPGAIAMFGEEPAPSAVRLSSTRIAVDAPAALGEHEVTVLAPDGQEHALARALLVVPPAPAIHGVSPAVGPVEGGRRVEVAGERMDAVVRVRLGGREPTGPIELVDAGRLRFTTEPGEAGFADLVLEDAEGRATTLESAYRFVHALHGLNFSPYLEGQDPNRGAVVGAAQVRTLIEAMAGYARWIRTFGLAGGLAEAGRIAGELGLRRAVGAWLGPDAEANAAEIGKLIDAAKEGRVDLAIVGSEAMLRGDLTETELVAYVRQVRTALAGLGIPVTTAEIWAVLIDHPKVVEACDVVMANIYPYWEGVPIADAAAALDDRHSRLVAIADGRKVIVSETGWPSDGDAVGGAVPSSENAARYFLESVSWAKAKKVELFYFSSRDEAWKARYEGPQGAHWGIRNGDGDLKPGMGDVFDGKSSGDTWSGVLIDGPGTPEIAFTSVPALDSHDDLEGRVSHVFAFEHRVAVYIRVAGGWWTKPTAASPLTSIRRSGSFVCDITTGGIDETADRIAAYLLPADATPPVSLGGSSLPASLSTLAVASVTVSRP